MNKRIYIALVVLALGVLACGSTTPRELVLYPSETPNSTQTPLVVQITTTPLLTQTPVIVVVTETPNALCVNALVAVYLRPSPSDDNYPIIALPNGSELGDLGGRSDSWLFVSYADKSGWVNGKYVVGCE